MHEVYLGLGSNMEAEDNLRVGIRELRNRFGPVELSPVYRNAPVGFSGKDFLNAVARVRTDKTPKEVLEVLLDIHAAVGRQPSERKFAARKLDIDLLLYDRLAIDSPGLKLPRRDVLLYSFVLRPLSELAPDYVHPQTGRRLDEHWQEFDAASHPLIPVTLTPPE